LRKSAPTSLGQKRDDVRTFGNSAVIVVVVTLLPPVGT
jgi:hypothetical protein